MRKITRTFVFSIVIFFLIPHYVSSREGNYRKDVKQFADYCLGLLIDNQYGKLSELFHLPESYNEQEKQNEIIGLREGNKFLAQYFGKIINANLTYQPEKHIDIQIGTGDLIYWRKHPEIITVVYTISSQTEKHGFVIFWFVDLHGNLELRSLAYGVPADDLEAVGRISVVGVKMTRKIMKIFSQSNGNHGNQNVNNPTESKSVQFNNDSNID